MTEMIADTLFMNVKQVADYLHLNEKKVYALASEGQIPATKVTGKWLFPKKLVDRWLLESCHSGLMADRLLLTGSDDPFLQAVMLRLPAIVGNKALYSYSVTGSRMGLSLLSQGHADVAAIHWGRAEESHLRHPGLVRQFTHYRQWVLVRAFLRTQGLIVHPDHFNPLQPEQVAIGRLRWVVRQEGAGSQRFLQEWLTEQKYRQDELNISQQAFSERELASMICRGDADIGPGSLSAAREYGLAFIPVCEEAFDLVVPRSVYFRGLFQQLFDYMQSTEGQALANDLGGYNLTDCGKMVWNGAE
ncbi:DNA binding domain-containing protein, excisionase family [Oceanospirillum multiglobuliferum]|uniref:DNA-binding protein n=1 Tax=Oceanospirillum multiglobuliferum TaxID=64969 RepID=A0A1T4P6I9_9GAMM|nr:helix-turn-helix transcriptional regulator [Oceanospirillum multiglobuliferum]OPX54856.1 DNA-binding protein [Oceanospirillum multiglobuliferum]SJZ86937.1 DNA binding domain-containing protein, excisionase family [Oceanospirillum multiglobuliferum]